MARFSGPDSFPQLSAIYPESAAAPDAEPPGPPMTEAALVRAVRLGHRHALGIPQPAQQFPALRVDDCQRVGEPGPRGRDQLEMKLRQP